MGVTVNDWPANPGPGSLQRTSGNTYSKHPTAYLEDIFARDQVETLDRLPHDFVGVYIPD